MQGDDRSLETRKAEFNQWIEGRRAAGCVIDTSTCDVLVGRENYFDPYANHPDLPEECMLWDWHFFVRSPTSEGWISMLDLPRAKSDELRKRVDREIGEFERGAPHLAELFQLGSLTLREAVAAYAESKLFDEVS